MKLTIKTLRGEKFSVDAEASNTVAEVKGIIEGAKSELPAANMRLIHSGKVLKDDASIESCNIKPVDFLVCMISKPKKAAAAAAAAPAPAKKEEKKTDATAAAAASAPSEPAPAAAAAAASSTGGSSTAASTEAAASPAPAPASDEFPAEVVGNLTGMGFPEAEVRACLRAAQGNPNVAVEYLMNGIPPGVGTGAAAADSSPSDSASGGGGAPLETLRNHPQFDALRRLVQSNPQTLQAVLTQIGQQQPELLREINENQAAFLEMMNEPVPESPAESSSGASGAGGGEATSGTSSTQSRTGGAGAGSGGAGAGALGAGAAANMLAGMADPAQMAQMLSNLSPAELNEMASMMGLTPQQLQATAQMISQMPAEQFQEYMMHAMQPGGGLPGLGGLGGGGGPQVLRLTEEEMASVDRLVDMGFDRNDAAQAFLACDKNEALAANLLMDSAGDGGFGFGGGDGGSGGGGGADGSGGSGGADASGGDDGDDMYD